MQSLNEIPTNTSILEGEEAVLKCSVHNQKGIKMSLYNEFNGYFMLNRRLREIFQLISKKSLKILF